MLFQVSSQVARPDASAVANQRNVRVAPKEETLELVIDYLRGQGFSENRLDEWFGKKGNRNLRLEILPFPAPLVPQEKKAEGFTGGMKAKVPKKRKTTYSDAELRRRLNSQYYEMDGKGYEKYKQDNHYYEISSLGRMAILFGFDYSDDFKKAEMDYGVPKEMVAAVLGIESKFGLAEGKYPVLSQLLTFIENRPEAQADKLDQLANFLRICKEYGLDPHSIRGSREGAILDGQYMPSTLWNKIGLKDKERMRGFFLENGFGENVGEKELLSFRMSIYLTAKLLKVEGATTKEGYGPESPNFSAAFRYNRDIRYARMVCELAQVFKDFK